MDDTAQNQSVQQTQVPQTTPPVQEPVAAQAAPVQQPSTVPQPAAPTMPQGISPRPEMGPVAVVNPVTVDADNDEQPVVRQEAPVIQQSHPEVVMPKEVASAGVTPGPDADSKQLPEEKQQLETVSGEAYPVVHNASDDAQLPMSYEQALEEEKKVKSPKSGLSWIIREILRQWRQRLGKTE